MSFDPRPNDILTIDGATYLVAEHPAAPGVAYGQEGRAAIVYQVVDPHGVAWALKVFRPRFRVPSLVSLAGKLAAFADIRGLSVCRRMVLTGRKHTELLRLHSDLTYTVLMPWINGPTWMQVVLEQQPFTPGQSLRLVHALLHLLAEMEERGLAHCDVSGPNVILPALAANATSSTDSEVALVDVEQMFGPDLSKPEILPGGSAGYAHKTAPTGLWSSNADRFAGAVLLAEVLGWCDERVRNSAAGESYFSADEVQRDSGRYRLLSQSLRDHWGMEVAAFFDRAWQSEILGECATFGEWLVVLPASVIATETFNDGRDGGATGHALESVTVPYTKPFGSSPSIQPIVNTTAPKDTPDTHAGLGAVAAGSADIIGKRPPVPPQDLPRVQAHSPLGCGAQLVWLAIYALGAVLAYGVGWALIWNSAQIYRFETLALLAFAYLSLSFFSGVMISLVQRLTFHQFAKRIRWWALGNAAVWTGISLIEMLLVGLEEVIAASGLNLSMPASIYPFLLFGSFVIHGMMMGLLTGIVQVLSLRTQIRPKGRWFMIPLLAWTLSSIFAGGTFLAVSYTLAIIMPVSIAETVGIFLGWSVGGALVGSVSSFVWRDISNSLLAM